MKNFTLIVPLVKKTWLSVLEENGTQMHGNGMYPVTLIQKVLNAGGQKITTRKK